MNYSKDYYKILQVHHLAEEEIIESSYRRLARKYHPDVNSCPEAEETMKEINEAYGVLHNPQKRKTYHQKWVRIQNTRNGAETSNGKRMTEEAFKSMKSLYEAKAVLNEYFQSLLAKDFEKAYSLVTENDKEKVPKADFLKWQNTVSKIYRLKEYNYTFRETSKNVFYKGVVYKEAIDLYVVVVEYNEIVEGYEKDYLVKSIVRENGGWRVLLGYEGLQPLIEKFARLSNLVKAKLVINELVEMHSKTDFLTGLSNAKGFLETAEKEVYRHQRYHTTFSIACCEIHNSDEETIKKAGQMLQRNLRKLDAVARWEKSIFVILFPESNVKEGILASAKIRKQLEETILRSRKSRISFGVVEFRHRSIRECLGKVFQYKELAKKLKISAIVSHEGIV